MSVNPPDMIGRKSLLRCTRMNVGECPVRYDVKSRADMETLRKRSRRVGSGKAGIVKTAASIEENHITVAPCSRGSIFITTSQGFSA